MRRTTLLFAALLLLAATSAWAFDIHMIAGRDFPAADGKIKVDHDHNGNTVVKLTVYHLAKPSAVDPALSTYVVWFQPRDREPELQGVIRLDKDLKGEFETSTPFKSFDVFVTAEQSPRPERPTGPEVLRGQIKE